MALLRRPARYVPLALLAGTVLSAQSECPKTAVGSETGLTYELTGYSLATSSGNTGVSALGASGSITYEEQYYKGYYKGSDGRIIEVNCSTLGVMATHYPT